MQRKTVSYASNMILDDHLKKVLNKSNPAAKKGNALLPRAQHSAFGDFPTTHLNKSKGQDMEPKPIGAAEQSVAAAKNAMRKFALFSPFPSKAVLQALALATWFASPLLTESDRSDLSLKWLSQ